MGNNYDDDPNFDWIEEEDCGPPERFFDRSARNLRYSNAYGDYRGGYGPGGGFGPPPRGPIIPPLFGPPPPHFMPGPGGPEPDFIWSRRMGPGGPRGPFRKAPTRDDRALRYLLRCGVPMEQLRNLPKEFFHMIEPQYCDLCNQNLISASISRMHYLSKNHLKNQKKWLMQRNERGPRAKEIPFKARDLYCELCDVHITSKSHAESHYAGKPHRSVVEGRKQPKNPMLLQRNMHDRLEQLIRREKKNLKPVEVKEEVAPVEEPKAVDPDLYCDICKTSVTCSDQMTMHLNGKRHLTKEKRHIFDMMKGSKNGEEGDDDDGDEGEENEGDEKEKEEDKEDDNIGDEEWHMDA